MTPLRRWSLIASAWLSTLPSLAAPADPPTLLLLGGDTVAWTPALPALRDLSPTVLALPGGAPAFLTRRLADAEVQPPYIVVADAGAVDAALTFARRQPEAVAGLIWVLDDSDVDAPLPEPPADDDAAPPVTTVVLVADAPTEADDDLVRRRVEAASPWAVRTPAGAVLKVAANRLRADRPELLAWAVRRVLDARAGAGPAAPVTVPPEVLARYAGRFRILGEMIVTLTVQDGTLYAEAPNLPRVALLPDSQTRFSVPGVPLSIIFEPEADGAVDSVRIEFQGQTLRARRLAQ